jgi:hypothetical protein
MPSYAKMDGPNGSLPNFVIVHLMLIAKLNIYFIWLKSWAKQIAIRPRCSKPSPPAWAHCDLTNMSKPWLGCNACVQSTTQAGVTTCYKQMTDKEPNRKPWGWKRQKIRELDSIYEHQFGSLSHELARLLWTRIFKGPVAPVWVWLKVA